MKNATPAEIRRAARAGTFAAPTAGLAPGYQQANIVIVPADVADSFLAYVQANPQACPLLAVGRAGDPSLPTLGKEIDIRTDLPRYRVFRHGVIAEDPTQVTHPWREDLVTFALGCSLGFEAALLSAGVHLRCFAPDASCSAFESTIETTAAGPFSGPLVASMRAVPAEHVELVREITAAHPETHGAPVHIGEPALIGVDLTQPIDGIGLTDVLEGEVPVFWACGVTPQYALQRAKLPLAITHAPGHMLVTDLPLGSSPSAQPV
ncbi:D-glutamate cyclase family protein [Chelativorans sp.]|uniref:D-glutamate cyclase family protein n=1 Tax=Chelativorans sp. TaxID=2203393 RepID=UPI0028112DE4|nr:DUF1445 domain-containing protein [Chelativorans sp.]